MEGETKQEDVKPSATTEEMKQDAQKAQQELKAVADRAKAATAGFSFEKLFAGRIDNVNYFYFAVISIVANYVLHYIPIVGGLIGIALMVLSIGMAIRRFHDIGFSGWYSLIFASPLLGVLGGGSMMLMSGSMSSLMGAFGLIGLLSLLSLLVTIYLCWKKGVPTANMYGEAPDPKRDLFKAVLNT